MMSDQRAEYLAMIRNLLDQVSDETTPIIPRIAATLATNPYFEALTRSLVDDARQEGTSWDDLAEAVGTSPANVQARYGNYRDYDDDPADET